ncbi:MAG TPA: TIGR02444 family protein [Spongiibacteraceae bacterium]|nr:TIGR02444 family protein [Spongiibacteraceae bacterium]
MADTLWEFAFECYRRDGVAACCLRLQDNAGADVNMLLAAAWLAERHLCWQHEQVRELLARCTEWREYCILPLRTVRRYLKGHDDLTLYAQAKSLELDAEIHQLHVLHSVLSSMTLGSNTESSTTRLTTNLQIYFDCLPACEANISASDRNSLVALLTR